MCVAEREHESPTSALPAPNSLPCYHGHHQRRDTDEQRGGWRGRESQTESGRQGGRRRRGRGRSLCMDMKVFLSLQTCDLSCPRRLMKTYGSWMVVHKCVKKLRMQKKRRWVGCLKDHVQYLEQAIGQVITKNSGTFTLPSASIVSLSSIQPDPSPTFPCLSP